MRPNSRPPTVLLLWLVSFALLAARISDAHVHLCFDGQEPRSSLHVSDHEPNCHTADGRRGSHQDQDIDLDAAGPVLVKKDAQAAAGAAIPPAAFLLLLLPPSHGAQGEWAAQLPRAQHRYSFLPPLRGPPV